METARERARLLSRRMEKLILVLMAILGLFVLYGLVLAWSDPTWIGTFVIERLALPKPPQFSTSTMLLLAAAFLAQAGLLGWALQTLRAAFREIGLHDIVGAESARLMRLSGVAFLTNAIAMALAPPLVSLIVSLDMPAGQRFLAISFGTHELLALILSGILIVFGHLLAVAAEVDDDNKRFV
ncbi:hypothetical protein [Aminobacter ciceronei]|jgi:hypothetical protein|uniref:DUF2975 domain-containing protein n=1 Tax=Aminobacter ciceronei TaxID=150723 RepID=A0ABR6C7N8_9HYPH|nr:hypothetical protein [Aminobacter ciceronei]MBA8907089.1 hypothetical protein [Aminobacter ciceronei]MBA9020653.1 hypothetical protein [Aminobacter ciceronei]